MSILEKISNDLKDGDTKKVKEGVNKALEKNIKPGDILYEGLLAGLDDIGEKFSNNEIFVPEVLVAARAMNAGMEILKPKLMEAGVESRGTMILGTVEGDLHDIGKNLVRMMVEGAGFDVIDLGTDVSAEEFIEAIKENNPDALGMSALLTTTMTQMQNVIEKIREHDLRDDLYIIVGGAPITDDYANEIGADSYCEDAGSAARNIKQKFA